MKRSGNLMPAILLFDNLLMAFADAAKGKSDRKEVIRFRRDLDRRIIDLQQQLSFGTLPFGRYRYFTVHDPKTRRICAAAFKERVAHHALMNVCGPILDRSQIHHSYACRKHKGQHRALKQAARWAGHHDYYLKMDIEKFFDSIDHGILKTVLARRIKDTRVLSLFADIIDSYHTAPGKGVPLGNLTSQHFANYYLNRFDLWMTQTVKAVRYLRYMDDMLVIGDKDSVCRIRERSKTWLSVNLALKLKHGGQINRVGKGIGFLGAVIYPGVLRMHRKTKKRVTARMHRYGKQADSGGMTAEELQHRTSAMWAGLCHMNTLGWRKVAVQNCGEA